MSWQSTLSKQLLKVVKETDIHHPSFSEGVTSGMMAGTKSKVMAHLDDAQKRSFDIAWNQSSSLARDNPLKTLRASVESEIADIVNDIDNHLGNHGSDAVSMIDAKIDDLRDLVIEKLS